MLRLFGLLVLMCSGLSLTAHATPLYPDRVAPAHRMIDGSTNHVFLERLPIPKPRTAESALPPPPAPAAPAKTMILSPSAMQPKTVNPYDNAPFQVKPRSDYKKLR